MRNIPGFGLKKADPSGTNFRNFGDKYGATKYDDLESISGQMVDYIRNQNLSDANLLEANRYTPTNAYGQVTPICLCGGTDAHRVTWFIASSPLPKGSGRFLTISEVALVVGLRAKQTGGASTPQPVNFHVDNRNLVGNPPAPGMDFYEIEAGLLVEGFACAQGWSEYRPSCGLTLGGFSGPQRLCVPHQNTQTGASEISVGKLELCGKQLLFDSTAASSAAMTAGSVPKDWIAWGGTLGTRFMGRMLTFKPILFPVPAGQTLPPFSFSGTAKSGQHLRLIIYDVAEERTSPAGVDVDNLIQFIPLAFPENNGGYPMPMSNPAPFRKYPGDAAAVAERLQDARTNWVALWRHQKPHPSRRHRSIARPEPR